MEYWNSWLSRTTLETSLIHEYTSIFTQNLLQKEDLAYFNHEFLQSLGIKTAKHRLEILRLVYKDLEKSSHPTGFGKLIWAFKKTKKLFNINNLTKWANVSHNNSSSHLVPFELSNCSKNYTLRRFDSGKEEKKLKKNVTKSGPLEKGMLEEMMTSEKWLSISGPLNEKIYQEKCMSTNRSPIRYRQINNNNYNNNNMVYGNKSPSVCKTMQERRYPLSPLGNHNYCDGNLSPWSLMFENMKPT